MNKMNEEKKKLVSVLEWMLRQNIPIVLNAGQRLVVQKAVDEIKMTGGL